MIPRDHLHHVSGWSHALGSTLSSIAAALPHRVTKEPRPVSVGNTLLRRGSGERVVLYTSADCWRGAGISFINIARGLARHGFDPHVVSMCPDVTAEFSRAGVPVTETARGRGESWRLRGLLRRWRAHVVIVDRAHDVRVATLAAAGTRVAVINRHNHWAKKVPTDLVTRVAYVGAVRDVVFLSAAAHLRVLDEIPFMRRARATTIYEGVDAGEFRPSRQAAVSFRRDFYLGADPFLLAVGALSPEKRYEFLFESLRRFSGAPTLLICGEGPQESVLRTRAAECGLDVRFLGRVPQKTLIGAYNAAFGLIHVGASETFGLAVLEAMACGRPIIASDGGALPEVVGATGEAGILVPADSHEQVASALRRLIRHPDDALALGRRARERARRLFSVEAMEDAYTRVVTRNMPSSPLVPSVRV